MRRGAVVALILVVGALAASRGHAALRLGDVNGRLAIGYTILSASDTSDTPGGSLSIGGGADIPLAPRLRAGVDVGYHLLGSRTLEQGSLTSGLDYSVFEVLALVHWTPTDRGPLLTVSAGPGLFVAKAELAATSVGLAFTPQAIDETRLGGSLAISAVRRRAAPVRVGLELGVRVVPLDATTWTLATARLVMRY